MVSLEHGCPRPGAFHTKTPNSCIGALERVAGGDPVDRVSGTPVNQTVAWHLSGWQGRGLLVLPNVSTHGVFVINPADTQINFIGI